MGCLPLKNDTESTLVVYANMPGKRPFRSIEFTVRAPFVLPEYYEGCEPAEIEQALTLGALVCGTVQSAKASAEIQDFVAKKQAEIESLRQRYEADKEKEIATIHATTSKKISELQSEMTAIVEERDLLIAKHAKHVKEEEGRIRQQEREMVTQQMNQRIQDLNASIHVLNERNAGLLERKSQLEMSRDEDIRQAQARAIALLQPALDEKDRSIASARDTIHTLTDNLRQLTESITRKQANAKLKGNDFEDELRSMLVRAYGAYERFRLEDSAKSGFGHAGDIIMYWDTEKILWESKNYDNTVPTAEVEKFRRDMREHRDIRVGVMISKHTGITGMMERGDMKTEFIDGQMLIYISNFHTFDSTTFRMLMELFHAHWKSEANTEKDESKESAIRQIEMLYTLAKQVKTDWRVQKSRMEEGLQFMSETVDGFEETIHRTLRNLRAGATTKHVEVPTNIFRPIHGDERTQRTIELLLEILDVRDGVSVPLNDIAKILAKRIALSENTAKEKIQAVILDSVLERKPGKPTLLQGLCLREVTST